MRLAAALAAGALALSGCTTTTEPEAEPTPSTSDPASTADTDATSDPEADPTTEFDLDLALSEPIEDSVYPEVGGLDVDTLLYDLDLTWAPEKRRLTGIATITFRAARTARRFGLDLAGLKVKSVTLDGSPAAYAHRGKDLTVREPITADDRHELVVTYAGRPRPVEAPTTRSDFTTLGFTVTKAGEVWTMQEPYGAHSWYPVNDQPADKALYDITVTTPDPMVGVANGRLVSDESDGGSRTTNWLLDEPASSYLITLAIGDYEHDSGTSASGVRVDYWWLRGRDRMHEAMQVAPDAVDWIEERLGPYPFSSLGIVGVDSQSAMETQTMITVGDNDYVLSAPVMVHELVHQWYGDQVSPADWSDVWLNEGMTMLLQALWEDDHGGAAIEATIADWRAADDDLRAQYGPPGAYDPAQFGGSNIYYSPAVMWDELRRELGEEEFFAVARSWLEAQDNQSATREEIYAHWEDETGLELSDFFDAWIEGDSTPPPGVGG